MKDFKLNKMMLICILLVCIVISLSIGVNQFSLLDLMYGDELAQQVFWQVRFVRVVALIFVGCGMVIAGLIMQQLAQNKFASPTSATTIDGARLGMLLSIILLPHNTYAKTTIAFICALLSTTIFILFLDRIKIKNVIFVPLFGLMLGGIINSVTMFIAVQADQVQSLNGLSQANLAHLLKGNYEILYIIIPAVILAYVYANQFTIVGLGHSFATNLGVNYKYMTVIGLVLVSIISAAVSISVGPVPFLGLIIPNIASIYYGDKLKNSIVETALLGCIFLFVCDIFGRVLIFPYEIPLTLTVGILGCIIFLMLIFKKKPAAEKEVTGH